MAEQHVHIGDQSTLATGSIQLAADGPSASLSANSSDGVVLISGGKAVNAQCGAGMFTIAGNPAKADISLQGNPASNITIALGPAVVGPRIEMSATGIEIAIGPPGLGASIKLTPVSITMSVGKTTYEMTPLGVSESALPVTSRKLDASGHQLATGPNSYALNMSGETASVLNSTVSAKVAAKVSGMAMAGLEASGQASVKGAIVMIN